MATARKDFAVSGARGMRFTLRVVVAGFYAATVFLFFEPGFLPRRFAAGAATD